MITGLVIFINQKKMIKRLKIVGIFILMFLWAVVGVAGHLILFLPIALVWLITGFSVIKWYGNISEKWFPDEFFKNN